MPTNPSTHPLNSNSRDTETLTALAELIDIVAQLRSPDGCPWDREQTPQSLIPYVIEEAYEVVDALRSGEPTAIAEELGDLLLQVVLQAQIAREAGQFDLKDVVQHITQKLIRRHPHVFGEVEVSSAEEVRVNWEQIKATEKGEDPQRHTLASKFSRYARTLPPLLAGTKISQRAAAAGFEWDCVEDVWAKLEEELGEFRTAIAQEGAAEQEAEFGDVLFALIQVARWHQIDPSDALHGTNRRFADRIAVMESIADRPLMDYTIAELEALWQAAKVQLARS